MKKNDLLISGMKEGIYHLTDPTDIKRIREYYEQLNT